MDKSPELENFMNEMAVMQGKGQPKMSATTMKIGSGGLEKRIANNERKITAIKNIFKSQKIEFPSFMILFFLNALKQVIFF